MRIKPGYGYYDCTSYPLGGSFHRTGNTGLEVIGELRAIKPKTHGCDTYGQTADGRKVAFDSANTDNQHA